MLTSFDKSSKTNSGILNSEITRHLLEQTPVSPNSAKKQLICVSYAVDPVVRNEPSVEFFVNPTRVATYLGGKDQGDHITSVAAINKMLIAIFNYNTFKNIANKLNVLGKIVEKPGKKDQETNKKIELHERETREKAIKLLGTFKPEEITKKEVDTIDRELIYAKSSLIAYYLSASASDFIEGFNKSRYSTSFRKGRELKSPTESGDVQKASSLIFSVEFIAYLIAQESFNTSKCKSYAYPFLPRDKKNTDSDYEKYMIYESLSKLLVGKEKSQELFDSFQKIADEDKSCEEKIHTNLKEIMNDLLVQSNILELTRSISNLYDFKQLLYFSETIKKNPKKNPEKNLEKNPEEILEKHFPPKDLHEVRKQLHFLQYNEDSKTLFENHDKEPDTKEINITHVVYRKNKIFFMKTLTNHLIFMYFSLENFFTNYTHSAFMVFYQFIYDLLICEGWIGIFKDEKDIADSLKTLANTLDEISGKKFNQQLNQFNKRLLENIKTANFFECQEACEILEQKLWEILENNDYIHKVKFDFKSNSLSGISFEKYGNTDEIKIEDGIKECITNDLQEKLGIKYEHDDTRIVPQKSTYAFYSKHIKTSKLNSDLPAKKYYGFFNINKAEKKLESDKGKVYKNKPYVECALQ